jgi:probable F420-dependent oxidoreductase
VGVVPASERKVSSDAIYPARLSARAAAHTHRVALGTSVLNLPWYNPVLLARQLTTLDVLSAGRLRIGFGMGWSPDEYEAAGVPWEERGKRADEMIQALKKIWTTNPVEFQGKYYRIAKSVIGPKPVQNPHPPIYMGAYAAAALKRVALEADGWLPVGIPLSGIRPKFEEIKQMAKNAGRDPATLALIVRANMEIHDTPVEKDRVDFTGSLEQIADDIKATEKLGAAEIVLDAQYSPGVETGDDVIARMEDLWRVAHQA